MLLYHRGVRRVGGVVVAVHGSCVKGEMKNQRPLYCLRGRQYIDKGCEAPPCLLTGGGVVVHVFPGISVSVARVPRPISVFLDRLSLRGNPQLPPVFVVLKGTEPPRRGIRRLVDYSCGIGNGWFC